MRRALIPFLLLVPLIPGVPAARAQNAPDGATSVQLTPADQGWIGRIQDTLNGITTLKARFQQIAPDGRRTTGTVWLDRPGRMRFEYDKPSPLLLVAGAGRMVFTVCNDAATTEIPLEKTPVGLLLRPNLSLAGDVTITGFNHANGLLQVALVRTATPGDGSLTVVLTDNPVALKGWSVIDAQGRETHVDLFDITTGLAVPQSLFETKVEQ